MNCVISASKNPYSAHFLIYRDDDQLSIKSWVGGICWFARSMKLIAAICKLSTFYNKYPLNYIRCTFDKLLTQQIFWILKLSIQPCVVGRFVSFIKEHFLGFIFDNDLHDTDSIHHEFYSKYSMYFLQRWNGWCNQNEVSSTIYRKHIWMLFQLGTVCVCVFAVSTSPRP